MLLSLNLEPAPGEDTGQSVLYQERDPHFGTPKLIRRAHEAEFATRRPESTSFRQTPFYVPFVVILSLNVFVISSVITFCALLMLS